MQHPSPSSPDICIAGAGIIGLSLALELHRRGLQVTILDQSAPLSEASTAAAGMLATGDPHNPSPLRPLADLSISLYPDFLDRLTDLSGIRVPFQTNTTLQALPHHAQHSNNELTPSDLARLLPATHPRQSPLHPPRRTQPRPSPTRRSTSRSSPPTQPSTSAPTHPSYPLATPATQSRSKLQTACFHVRRFIDCSGAWASTTSHLLNPIVVPRKGQMFSVSLPPSLPLNLVVRTPDIYIVPRTSGPHAGRAIIGATIEDAGFDKTVHPSDIARLRNLAAQLLPALADAPQLEAWAGLRPATLDGLPLLGELPSHPNHFIATGHYRDGILLAPATAHVMAQLLIRRSPLHPSRSILPLPHLQHTCLTPYVAQRYRYSRTPP